MAAVKLDGTPAKKSGRPPKLTPELIAKVADVVASGAPMDTAARYCGVDRVSFHYWLKLAHAQRQAKKRGRHLDFLNALEEAQARADTRDHAYITKASAKDWKAALNHLRIRNPGRYAQQVNVLVRGQFEAVIARLKQEFADEPDTLERALSALAGEDGGGGPGESPGGLGGEVTEGGVEDDADSLSTVVASAGVPRPGG